MNVETLRLKNFKRFTDLKIDLSSSAGPAKLVLLIGANGSGKSSVFDAFEYLSGPSKGTSVGDQYRNYVDKNEHADVSVRCSFGGGIVIHRSNHGEVASTSPNWGAQAFYGRSSLRTVPELRYRHEDEIEVASDSDRPQRSIDQDTRFETDIAQITERILREVWGERFDAEIMKARFVDPINDALARVFSNGAATNLRLVRMIPALQGKPPDIRFRKGRSDIHYDLLSSGEKEVFNILVNLFSRREHFANTIYFIDELDVHLHTRLQYALLQEIVEHWIPDHSQLWTASHSLGFIDYANSSDEATVIDFDDLDFDQSQVLRPAPKSERVFDIAVPRNSAIKVFPNKRLILCENTDVTLYNAIGLENVLFVSARDKNAISIQTRDSTEFHGVIDRDYLGTNEIDEIRRRQPNLMVLGYYALENYLYHPENIEELSPLGFDGASYLTAIRASMQTIRDRLLVHLEKSRNGYEIIKTFSRDLKDHAIEEIARVTAADDFKTFYPFLDMKSHRPSVYLAGFNLRPTDLAATAWMRAAIASVLRDVGVRGA